MSNDLKVTSLAQFVSMCADAPDNDFIINLFEDETSEDVREEVFAHADPDSPEPFRSAMIALGFPDF